MNLYLSYKCKFSKFRFIFTKYLEYLIITLWIEYLIITDRTHDNYNAGRIPDNYPVEKESNETLALVSLPLLF